MRRLRTWVAHGSGMLLVALLLLFALEGIASLVTAWRRPARRPALAERLHTEHDPLLGWINRPDQSIPDMYCSSPS